MKKLCVFLVFAVSMMCAEEVVTHHELEGQAYTAKADTLTIKGDDGKEKADIFYVAYTLDSATEKLDRPLTFCFNGGPGSSSVWLHLGAFGPKRIHHDEQGRPTLPALIKDNPEGLLDLTDLVFIDPVSTGYSQPAEGEEGEQFYGLQEDATAIAEFIRLYITREGRWSGPLYLAGESYGTTRAAVLAEHLQSTHHIFVDGLILVSPILDFHTVADFSSNQILPFILSLPTYTATAWHHQKLDEALLAQPLNILLKEVEQFTVTYYATALLLGEKLSEKERLYVAQQLAKYTGLSPDYFDKADLKVPIYRFLKELLRDERRTVGRLDSRYLGIDVDLNGQFSEHDPCMDLFEASYAPAINQYLKQHLQWKADQEYHLFSLPVLLAWKWSSGPLENNPLGGYVDVSAKLALALTRDPNLRVLALSGYHDLATPYFAAEYTFNHLGLDPTIRENITLSQHPGGHMIYADPTNLTAIKEQIRTFLGADQGD